MKVNIAPYRRYIGPYQIAEKLLFWRDKYDDSVHNLGTWLSNTFIGTICPWIHEKKKRKIQIRIDPYDTWGMDHTLGLIILPMLKQMKATKHGSPCVDDMDVPEELRSTTIPKPDDYDVDDNWHKRWEWVLDEMIWAFEQIINENSDSEFFDFNKNPIGYDSEGHKEFSARVVRGTTLFGKYYQGLWD